MCFRAIKIMGILFFLLVNIGCNNHTVDHEKSQIKQDTLFVDISRYLSKGKTSEEINQVLSYVRFIHRGPIIVFFSPGVYSITHSSGIRIFSDMIFRCNNSLFVMNSTPLYDGQYFLVKDVQNFQFYGGILKGHRENWPDSANIRGFLITGNSSNIVISDVIISNLSSNGIGIFGNELKPIANVTITNVLIENCSNKYNDYLEPNPGPVLGTSREDQGNIAFYYVTHFEVANCIFKSSKSDGTHFFKCYNGKIINNLIIDNKMGGYFVETSNYIYGENNIIENNGSRGATIERNSSNNVFRNNIVRFNGREGLWADDVTNLQVISNAFVLNGRRKDFFVSCNINITDTSWPINISNPKTRNVYIFNNYIETDTTQWFAIRVQSSAINVKIVSNFMLGKRKTIRADCWLSGVGKVVIRSNYGWKTENQGIVEFSGNGVERFYQFAHNLDFSDPENPNMLKYVKIFVKLIPLTKETIVPAEIKYDIKNIIMVYKNPLPPGRKIKFKWFAWIGYLE